MGLPTSSHMTEQIRGDNSLRVSRKNSRGNRDAGMAVNAMMGRKKGFCRIFEPFGCYPKKAGNHWGRPPERVREEIQKTGKKIHESLVRV